MYSPAACAWPRPGMYLSVKLEPYTPDCTRSYTSRRLGPTSKGVILMSPVNATPPRKFAGTNRTWDIQLVPFSSLYQMCRFNLHKLCPPFSHIFDRVRKEVFSLSGRTLVSTKGNHLRFHKIPVAGYNLPWPAPCFSLVGSFCQSLARTCNVECQITDLLDVLRQLAEVPRRDLIWTSV